MAENINIKVLIDAADAAKTVGDTRKALKDLRSAALQVEEGSEAFKSLTRAAGQLQDRMADLSAEVKYFAEGNPLIRNAQGMVEIMGGVGSAFNVAQGALALFGQENSKLEATMQKMVVVMGIMNGLKELSTALDEKSNLVLFVQNGIKATAVRLAGEEAIALAAEAVAAGTATVAQRALNAAMTANPILAVIGLLATLTGALFAFTSSNEKATEQEKAATKASEERAKAIEDEKNAYNDFVAKEAAGYIQLADQLKRTNPGSRERLELIGKINETYGTTLKNLTDEKAFQDQVNTSVDKYIQFLRTKYMLMASQKDQEASFKRQAELEKQLTDAQIKRGMTETQLNAKRNTVYRDINLDATPEGKQLKQIDETIAALEKKRDYEIATQKVALQNAYSYGKQISESGLKLAGETVKIEKDKNTKIIKEKKDFVADYNKLDEEILNNNVEIADEISKKWSDTYDQQVINLEKSLIDQKAALTTEYKGALDEIQAQFEEWRNSDAIKAKIELGGWDIAKQQAEFYSANAGFLQRKATLEQQMNLKIQLLEANHYQALEKLQREHNDRVKKAMMESSQAILASPEYKRYLEYIDQQNKTAQAKIIEADKKSIVATTNTLIEKSRLYKKYQEDIARIAKEENLQLEKDAAGMLSISSDFINALGEDADQRVVNDYNYLIGKSNEFKAELQQIAQSYVNSGTTIGEQLNKVVAPDFGQDLKQSLLDIASTFPPLADEAKAFVDELSLGTSDADKQMVKYIGTLARLKLIDPRELNAMKNFSEAVDKVNGSLDISSKLQEKVGKETEKTAKKMTKSGFPSWSEAWKLDGPVQEVQTVFEKVFSLRRKITASETGENKLLIAVYRDKLQILQKGEAEIAKEIEKANANAIDAANARVQAQTIVVQNAEKTTKEAIEKLAKEKKVKPEALSKEDTDRLLAPLTAAKEELVKFQSEVAQAMLDKGLTTGFKLFPTKEEIAKGVMSLEDAIKKYPEIANKITESTQKRYEDLAKISNEFYEKEKFELFMSLQKGAITQEEYDSKLETMKVNHEENMLSLDVAYGKKGQDALEENEKKKTAIIKSEEDERKSNKEKALQEALTLESQFQQLIMQIYQQGTDRRIENIGIEYQARMDAIDEEKKAWEDSLKERTVAQIQEDEKRDAYDKEKKRLEKERDMAIRAEKMEQFKRQKVADIATATINGAVAFTKALATLGPYAVLIQGLIAAQTAAQIAIIASQEPGFAKGGLVTGPGGPKDDKIKARLSNGESVINAKSTKMFAPILSAINQAGGGNPIPSAAGGNMADGGGGMPVKYIGEKAMSVDNSDVVAAIDRLSQRPIETYVKESSITSAQNTRRKEDRRSSY